MSADIKYTDRDVRENDNLVEAAYEFLEAYTGEFEFLIDCKMRVAQGTELSVGMVRGVLNCMRADPRVRNMPAPLPPDETVVEFKPRPRQQRKRKERIPCDIEGYHTHTFDDWQTYEYCEGKYAINRDINLRIPLHVKVPFMAAQSPSAVLHLVADAKVHVGAEHFMRWDAYPHEYGYNFRSARSWYMEERYGFVEMVEMVVVPACNMPRNIKNPILLSEEQMHQMQSDEELCRIKCIRCFPR